jgi:PKD repeat protein
MRDYGLIVFALLFSFALLSGGCGQTSLDMARGSSKGLLTLEAESATATRSNQMLDLQGALQEVRDYIPPGEVDSLIFERLRNELLRQIEERLESDGRLVSQVPPGNTGKVTDFALNSATGELTWSYMNLGDYDLSGEVGVPDITPIAVNYLKKSTESELVAWIDGDGNGEVGVPDVTPIAQNYLNTVQGYEFVTANSLTGPFTKIGDAIPFSEGKKPSAATGPAPVKFSVSAIPAGMKTYLWVRAVSSTGGVATLSNRIEITGEAPSISSVSPSGGVTGVVRTFSAIVTGDDPLTYDWNFGGGATPDVSAEVAPEVTLGDVGTNNASLTVTNLFGSDTFNFNLNITAQGTPPSVISISPVTGTAGTQLTINADVAGSRPLNYWSFAFLGGGATPTVVEGSVDPVEATITLGAAGEYSCWFSVANDFGFVMQHIFTLTVEEPGGVPPQILSVSPTVFSKLSSARLEAKFTGAKPVDYEWNFGSGATPNIDSGTSGATYSFWADVTAGDPGTYNCTVTATNPYGSDQFEFILEVTNAMPPEAVLWAVNQAGVAPLTTTFDPTKSADQEPGEMILMFEIDFESDGTFDWSSPVPVTTSHVYPDTGDYIATLKVTSSSGLSTTTSAPVLVFASDPYLSTGDDGVFLYSTRQNYSVGDEILLGVFVKNNLNPLSQLIARIGVPQSSASLIEFWKCEYFYNMTGTPFPPIAIQSDEYFEFGILYLMPTPPLQGVTGLSAVIKLVATQPGSLDFLLIEADGPTKRTYYVGTMGQEYLFSSYGKDYGSGLTPIYTVNVS